MAQKGFGGSRSSSEECLIGRNKLFLRRNETEDQGWFGESESESETPHVVKGGGHDTLSFESPVTIPFSKAAVGSLVDLPKKSVRVRCHLDLSYWETPACFCDF